jgi:DNA-binding CsgD family transcriptional regulator
MIRSGERLLGRRSEREMVDRLLGAARIGQGGVLVLVGDPGVGKTALLEYAIEVAPDFRVVRAMGIEGEMDLPFAGLQQLCSPLLGRLERLAGPQRHALAVAFGLREGDVPDRFLIGLALLSLLSTAARAQPVLCVIDDAQWLDRASAQALSFVARRLLAERVAILFAARKPIDVLGGLPQLAVEGLAEREAQALLASVLPERLDQRVRDRIVAETRGNPLALLELPRGLTPAQLAGGFGLPAALPLSGRIEESFRRRLSRLPRDTRRLLLVAAADAAGDPALVWRSAERLGIHESAADAAESEGLIEFGSTVIFRHPLVRSAIYRASSPGERREAHRALAEATDADVDPDRRAWHLAEATPRPTEEVAVVLERSADRARARGGFAAAAAFLERSASLTVEPSRRAARALAAAQAKQQAGALDAALTLVSMAEAGALDEFQKAQVDVLRAQISFASNRGSDAPPLLLKAARRLEPLDARLSRDTYLDALTAALFAGRLAKAGDAREVAHAASGAVPPPSPPRASDLLLDALALMVSGGASAGASALREALTVFRSEQIRTEEGLRWLWLAGRAAAYIWDYDSWDALTARQIELAREAGALTVLPLTLSTRAGVHLFAGKLREAAWLIDEANSVTEATDNRIVPYGALALAAFRGCEPDATRLIEASTTDFVARGEGMGLTLAQWATAALYNGLARYEDALAAAEQAAQDPHELWFSTWTLVELIEAAARSANTERAAGALELLTRAARASGTAWALGIERRSRALLARGEEAEILYRDAIEQLEPTPLRVDLARAHLLYGEWLRRNRRRLEARAQLRNAHRLFTEFGMEGYAERARIELRATGERARKRSVATRDELTPQETQVSRLAAQGATNQEIAAQLFISPSTVEYHLSKAFRKLDVKSRTQLAHRMLHSDAGADLDAVEP